MATKKQRNLVQCYWSWARYMAWDWIRPWVPSDSSSHFQRNPPGFSSPLLFVWKFYGLYDWHTCNVHMIWQRSYRTVMANLLGREYPNCAPDHRKPDHQLASTHACLGNLTTSWLECACRKPDNQLTELGDGACDHREDSVCHFWHAYHRIAIMVIGQWITGIIYYYFIYLISIAVHLSQVPLEMKCVCECW